jgi:hypothetical protein
MRHHPKGTELKPTEQIAQTQSHRTHRLAALRGLPGVAGSGAPSAFRLLLPTLLLAVALVALAAAPAMAARGHAFQGETIGEPCTVEPCTGAHLKAPTAVAVNEATGDIYVLDQGNATEPTGRVVRFNSAGVFQSEFDGSGSHGEGTVAGHGGNSEEVQTGRFDYSGEAASPRWRLTNGLAVDNSCSLQTPPLTGAACEAFDPSYGDVYVIDHQARKEPAVVDKYSATGIYLGQITRNETGGHPECAPIPDCGELGFRFLLGVAVDPRGEVWVSHINFGASPSLVANYTNAQPNVRIGSRAIAPATGSLFAVDSQDNLYAGSEGANVYKLYKFPSSGGMFNTEESEREEHEFGLPPVTGVATDLTTDDVYVDDEAVLRRYTSAESELESLVVPGGHGSGVAVDASTDAVYAADSSTDLVYVYSLEAPGPPTVAVGSTSVLNVTADSAGFEAEVNPRSESNEAPTTYRFEYGPCATPATCASSPYESSTPVPAGELAPNYEPDLVTAALTGLTPATAYHFRLSAENSLSTSPTLGEERAFTTQPAALSTALPDSRQWQLVSPPDKHGANLKPINVGPIQAAADGSRLAYLATAPVEAEPAGNANLSSILAARGPAGWSSRSIGTPHGAATTAGQNGPEYRAFSSDLSLAVVEPLGELGTAFLPLSPAASEQTLYLRTNFSGSGPCSADCYRPLVTGCPPEELPCPPAIAAAANVPPGTVFGRQQAGSNTVNFRGATPDMSQVVLEQTSPVALAPGGGAPGDLYEYSAGALSFVGHGGFESSFNSISTDGSRVVFTKFGNPSQLLLRDTATGQLLRLDQVTSGSGQGVTQPVFQYATPDSSKIFFTDSQRLTAGAGAAENKPDLYQCEIVEQAGELACDLTDLTPLAAAEEPAKVLPLILGSSADGSYLYFVAEGVLASNQIENGNGPEAPRGAHPNLYLYHAGTTSFIATLSGADAPDWNGFEQGVRTNQPTRVSVNGRWLAFMSQRPLTGYDNRDALSGEPDEEVLLYHAAAGGGEEGKLICASCNPTDARPRGVEYDQIESANARDWPPHAWIAANVPGWTPYNHSSVYQSRYLSNSGRLFFNSSDALSPRDTNATEDVYQSEPAGVGGCTAANPTYSPASGACLGLISSGTSKSESAFLDASESGDDVFFLTAAKLTAQDVDTSLDVYDAHACSTASPCLPEPPPPAPLCAGDACQQPAVPPVDATPGSLTFNGAGNLVECSKGKVKKSGKCVAKKSSKKKHHKKKGHKKQKRANSNRGGQK